MSASPTAVEVCCCYASEDEPYLKQLETHLSTLKRQGLISLWHDQQILPGANRTKTIETHLEKASTILLLISADFLASDYCYSVEMQRALERHAANDARVIPVIIRPCDWKGLPFASLQVLPLGANPISVWADAEAVTGRSGDGLVSALCNQRFRRNWQNPNCGGICLSLLPGLPDSSVGTTGSVHIFQQMLYLWM